MVTQTAIVTGAAGQDGYYLTRRLVGEGTTVHAVVRDVDQVDDLRAVGGPGSLVFHEVDLMESRRCTDLIARILPDEIYNLAGVSSVSASFQDPMATWATNAHPVQAMLEAVRTCSPNTRFYQSSSTEMFGAAPGESVTHNEHSRFVPQSPYAAAKAAAHLLCGAYRRAYGLKVAAGILSNHESHRRARGFLTRRVVDHIVAIRAASAVRLRRTAPLAVGNLAAERDWGFAPDYVDAIVRVMRQIEIRSSVLRRPMEADVGSNYRDYVLGSGRLHAVWQLVDRAFALAQLPLEWDRSSLDPADWTAAFRATGSLAVVVDRQLIRPADPAAIRADPSLARRELGWAPRAGLDRFLRDMLEPTNPGVAESA